MKKNIFLIFFVLLFFGFTSLSCFAQTSNNEQRIIGTWVNEANGRLLVLNSNGTGTSGVANIKYGVAGDKIALVYTDGTTYVFEFSISSDGRTLILFDGPLNIFDAAGMDKSNGALYRKRA